MNLTKKRVQITHSRKFLEREPINRHGKKAIKKGQIFADPIQHPDKMGIQIVDLIVKYQAGEEFPQETLLPATLYTKVEADQDPDLK